MKRLLLPLFFLSSLSASEGEEIYKKACLSCHSQNGSTEKSIELLVKPRKLTKTILNYDQSYLIIREGAHHWGAHSNIMSSFKYLLTDKQIHSVTDYITKKFNTKREERVNKLLAASKKLSDEEMDNRLALGEKVFKKTCSLCHGINGDAKSDYVEKSKEDREFIYPYNLTRTLLDEDQIFLYAKYGGHFWGTYKKDMPSWKKRYNDVALKSVAHYIQTKIKKLD